MIFIIVFNMVMGTKKHITSVLAFSGSCDAVVVIYTDVLRPTIERQPIELLRLPDVRSIGIGSILTKFDGAVLLLQYQIVDWKKFSLLVLIYYGCIFLSR